jgi:transcriptional regulatory protein LevR
MSLVQGFAAMSEVKYGFALEQVDIFFTSSHLQTLIFRISQTHMVPRDHLSEKEGT